MKQGSVYIFFHATPYQLSTTENSKSKPIKRYNEIVTS